MAVEGRSRGAIRRLASRQHGVVARWQLVDLGLSRNQIEHFLACAFLAPVHRGVHAVGHDALTSEGRWMAAVLAVGGDAVLSHRSAAALWGFAPDGLRPEVTSLRSSRRNPEIRVHRATVPADEQRRVKGMVITDPSRTLLDLAGVVNQWQLERAHREAHVIGLPIDLEALLRRYPGRRGIRNIRGLLGEPIERSELERRFRQFLVDYALPPPDAINVVLPWGEVDCVWWEQRVCVEVDGHGTHRTRAQFERDRSRDRTATAAGWRVVRVTDWQIKRAAASLAQDLRAILERDLH